MDNNSNLIKIYSNFLFINSSGVFKGKFLLLCATENLTFENGIYTEFFFLENEISEEFFSLKNKSHMKLAYF